ncbi:MAG: hypothetical protein AMDU3_IPLC00003G0019 [Thermoplasmatales archaeon I-plasma]|nr:MAG: hypothetical protein AMDU3_IPLC00003G0019 [Thermoplasmatales archaeon I-plasma]
MKDESGSPNGFHWDRNIRLKDFVMWWEGRLQELDGQTQRAKAELSAVTENIEKAREELVKVRNDVIATRELLRGEPDDQLRKLTTHH